MIDHVPPHGLDTYRWISKSALCVQGPERVSASSAYCRQIRRWLHPDLLHQYKATTSPTMYRPSDRIGGLGEPAGAAPVVETFAAATGLARAAEPRRGPGSGIDVLWEPRRG